MKQEEQLKLLEQWYEERRWSHVKGQADNSEEYVEGDDVPHSLCDRALETLRVIRPGRWRHYTGRRTK